MASSLNVALIGATGNLGPAILNKLLDAGFNVTILTRQGSTSTSKLPSHQNQTVKEVDYSSKESLVAALKGVHAVISTVASASTGDQNTLIDAAIEAGSVTRFIPSEFGSDIFHPLNKDLPVFAPKHATHKYLEEVTATHPQFSYTLIQNSAFLDWGIQVGFLVNAKDHTATLWNGGDRPFSATTLSTIGDAVVAVLKNPDATKNRVIRVHDAVLTQNQIISTIKKIDGKEWTTTVKDTEEAKAESYAEMKKPDANMGKAMIGFLWSSLFGEGREQYASKVDNQLLGLKELSAAEVEEVIRRTVQA